MSVTVRTSYVFNSIRLSSNDLYVAALREISTLMKSPRPKGGSHCLSPSSTVIGRG
jgi:hypothetical protein